jgi:hypothetical protein
VPSRNVLVEPGILQVSRGPRRKIRRREMGNFKPFMMILALVGALGLVACSGGGDDTGSSDETTDDTGA